MILVSLLVAAFLAASVPALAQPETGSAAAQQLTETEAAAVLVDAGQL